MPDRFTMTPLTLTEMLEAFAPGWSLPGAEHVVVDELCIDSRQAVEGSLFVAFIGEQTDGHAYVGQALEAGARMALVERPIEGVPTIDMVDRTAPETISAPIAVRVPDTLQALQRLAHRRRCAHPDLRVVGVTGSVGKTTAKEVIATVLSQRYAVLKSKGNHNNEIGLPLTLMTLNSEHERAVLEMGMYALEEIAMLCAIAEPQVGVVTNVEPVHLERLGTIDRIAQAKAELVASLPSQGVAILNADDPRVAAMARCTEARVVTYGTTPKAMVRAEQIESLGLDGIRFTVHVAEKGLLADMAGTRRLSSGLLGAHAIMPALAAVAVALVEGLSWEEIERGLAAQGQGLRLVTRYGKDGITVLDDSYNSSPASAISALDFLAGLDQRRIAVLGDMLELGEQEAQGHRDVGTRAAATSDLLITVGSRARIMAEAAQAAGMPAEVIHMANDNDQAMDLLGNFLQTGDVVLVKGSRSMQMEQVVASLLVVSP